MPQISPTRLAAFAAAALLVVGVGLWSLSGDGAGAVGGTGADGSAGRVGGQPPAGTSRPGGDAGSAAEAGSDSAGVSVERPPAVAPVVHVAGAVRRAGVYRLAAGARVQDAVRRAGGAAPDANLDAVNLAAKVADGQQIVVPQEAAPGAAPTGASGGDVATDPAEAAPVGLNAATLEQLQTLDGVGPATAEKIVAWRTEHGGFRSVDDLGQVPGIGPKRLAALRDHVQP